MGEEAVSVMFGLEKGRVGEEAVSVMFGLAKVAWVRKQCQSCLAWQK